MYKYTDAPFIIFMFSSLYVLMLYDYKQVINPGQNIYWFGFVIMLCLIKKALYFVTLFYLWFTWMANVSILYRQIQKLFRMKEDMVNWIYTGYIHWYSVNNLLG